MWGYNNSDWSNDYSYEPPPEDVRKTKKKHEWKPVLLLVNTVYDCKHCGTHKEECKNEYCEEEQQLW